jgi:hypothetical protein
VPDSEVKISITTKAIIKLTVRNPKLTPKAKTTDVITKDTRSLVVIRTIMIENTTNTMYAIDDIIAAR